jgi:hypothetical protein
MTPDEVVGKISMSMEGEGLAHFLDILRMGIYTQADVIDSYLLAALVGLVNGVDVST